MKSQIARTSPSVTHAPWIRTGFEMFEGANSMSPCPTSFSAPFMSRITRESAWDEVISAMRDGMFALISPVTTSTRRTLGGHDEMDPDGARHLRDAADRVLHVPRRHHHQVGELVDDDDDERHVLELLLHPGGIRSVPSRRPSS